MFGGSGFGLGGGGTVVVVVVGGGTVVVVVVLVDVVLVEVVLVDVLVVVVVVEKPGYAKSVVWVPVPIVLVPVSVTTPVPAGTVTVADVAFRAVTTALVFPNLNVASESPKPVSVTLVPTAAFCRVDVADLRARPARRNGCADTRREVECRWWP